MTNVNVSRNTIGSTIISSPITTESTTITLTNNNFIENVIKSASTSSDIVTTTGDSVTITNSEFDGVSGQFLQCGVLKGTNSEVIIEDSKMYDYYGIDSSLICLDDSSTLVARNNDFHDLTGSGTGVIKLITNTTAYLESCNFSTITAANYSDLSHGAGGLYISQSENVTLNNVNVKNVSSHGNGGCAWVEKVDFYATNVNFDSCVASGDGGVVFARDDSQIEILNGVFKNNKGADSNNGGAMAIWDTSTRCRNCQFVFCFCNKWWCNLFQFKRRYIDRIISY